MWGCGVLAHLVLDRALVSWVCAVDRNSSNRPLQMWAFPCTHCVIHKSLHTGCKAHLIILCFTFENYYMLANEQNE